MKLRELLNKFNARYEIIKVTDGSNYYFYRYAYVGEDKNDPPRSVYKWLLYRYDPTVNSGDFGVTVDYNLLDEREIKEFYINRYNQLSIKII